MISLKNYIHETLHNEFFFISVHKKNRFLIFLSTLDILDYSRVIFIKVYLILTTHAQNINHIKLRTYYDIKIIILLKYRRSRSFSLSLFWGTYFEKELSYWTYLVPCQYTNHRSVLVSYWIYPYNSFYLVYMLPLLDFHEESH